MQKFQILQPDKFFINFSPFVEMVEPVGETATIRCVSCGAESIAHKRVPFSLSHKDECEVVELLAQVVTMAIAARYN